MDDSPPPIKPPRGIKPVKETSGLLMSVIRTLSASETNEQRDREKANLESQYKICDQRLNELVLKHEGDLIKVTQLFGTISQILGESRTKVARVKGALVDCTKLLRCRRDELKTLWTEALQYKYMIKLLEDIEKLAEVPSQLSNHMTHKRYFQATKILTESTLLNKSLIDEVDCIKEIVQDIEHKKEQLHAELLSELNQQLYVKPALKVLSVRRQGSKRGVANNSPLQRSNELRLSARRSAACRNILETNKLENSDGKDLLSTQENLESIDENSLQFMAVLVKCLALLKKLPLAVEDLENNMEKSLSHIVERTSQHVKDFSDLQSGRDNKSVLNELVLTLISQFREVAKCHKLLISYIEKTAVVDNIDVTPYKINDYWKRVQEVLQTFLATYLDIHSITAEVKMMKTIVTNDLSSYFTKKRPQSKRKALFKLDGSSSALTLSSTIRSSKTDKILVCDKHLNNILTLFIPFMAFIDDLEQELDLKQGSCPLYSYLTQITSSMYLEEKSNEIINEIREAVKRPDSWKATVLLDTSTDYKPILVSSKNVERCIREWRVILKALPLYSEQIVENSCVALKQYKDACYNAYKSLVQPHSDDKRICSAAWLKDEDISRFLKSLPNWVNLKSQQEYQARSERSRRVLRRDQPSEEESPEDVRMRNRKEAEILAGNLGEGGVDAGEILSDMNLLKELAQFQESMEWFSVRMFNFASDFRHEPGVTPPKIIEHSMIEVSKVSANKLQQLTSIAQEFDELANTCLLLLHLEVRVQCFHYLLAQTHFNKETHEADPKVLELSRVLANVDEAMTSSLHPRKCKYIFEGLGHLIAKILISSAQYMTVINDAGIQRMCRNIFALQQTLTNITMTRELALDHARHYFELFFLSPEDILNGIVEKGPEFSELEYMNAFQLLNRSSKGKQDASVTVHLERLSDILGGVGATV